ncbi:MAG: glycosyltransferase [Propionibacteriaceae bacterium]|nr:glycosyltransferase [Propionibacteriaceae bacterium]
MNDSTKTKKALMVAHASSVIHNFNMRNLEILTFQGFELWVAANFDDASPMAVNKSKTFRSTLESLGYHTVSLPLSRGIGRFGENYSAVRTLRALHRRVGFDLVHIHSALAGVLTRVAIKKKSAYIMYTAHGFQFESGGPLRDWLVFFPIEWALSRRTHTIITMNAEDTVLSRKFFRPANTIEIPGVGIDFDRFSTISQDPLTKAIKKTELGFPHDAKLAVSIGEMIPRKNYLTIIRAIAEVRDPDLHYVICGSGQLWPVLQAEVETLELCDHVHMVGHTDVFPYLEAADFAIHLSLREGLCLGGLEMMAAGLPLIASRIRGLADYHEGDLSGFLISRPKSVPDTVEALRLMGSMSPEQIQRIGAHNRGIASQYTHARADEAMASIYGSLQLSSR